MERKARLEANLATVKFEIDRDAHIRVRKELCRDCARRPCVLACPAGNYEWDDGSGELFFNYQGCLECGTCRFVCPLDAVEWSYPRGGFGVRYLWG